MSVIVTRNSKGAPLTNAELDANFENINAEKLEVSNNLSELTDTTTARSNLGAVSPTDAANNAIAMVIALS